MGIRNFFRNILGNSSSASIPDDQPRGQHYVFAHIALSRAGLSNPGKILQILASDESEEFLHSLWEAVGKDLPAREHLAPNGLSCIFRRQGEQAIAVITLPEAQRVAEAYFTAFVFTPEGISLDEALHPDASEEILQKVSAEYYTLEYGFTFPGTPSRTVFAQWTTQGHHNMGDGPAPDVEAFYEFLCSNSGSTQE